MFVIGYFGDWRRAAAVLFERQSLSWDSPPSRETGENIAPTLSARRSGGGGLGGDFDYDGGLIAHSLRGEGYDASEDGTGRGIPLIARSLTTREGSRQDPTLETLIPFDITQITSRENRSNPKPGDPSHPLSESGYVPSIASTNMVRRLTPRECERLQGFPDDYTLIPYRGKKAADGPRYKSLGNSMAVPVMRWIGQRISQVDVLPHRANYP